MSPPAGSAVIGELPNDAPNAIALSQNGIVHRWRWADDGSEQDMLVLGAGASVSFSGAAGGGPQGSRKSADECSERLAAGEPHAPLAAHLSGNAHLRWAIR